MHIPATQENTTTVLQLARLMSAHVEFLLCLNMHCLQALKQGAAQGQSLALTCAVAAVGV